jgi:hypothetical protein
VKNSSPSYRSVTLNPKWCTHSFSKILLLLLLLLLLLSFHVRPTAYEKEGTAVSVHMLQGLYCYTVGVHIVRSLRMSGSVPPIQHVSCCRTKSPHLIHKNNFDFLKLDIRMVYSISIKLTFYPNIPHTVKRTLWAA